MIYLSLLFLTIIRLYLPITTPMERWDEQTNLHVIQESIVPVLSYEGQPFFEKPPLWYYLNSIFSSTLTFLRIESAFIALVTILLIVYFVYKKFNKTTAIIVWTILLLSNQLFTKNIDGYFATHTFSSADPDTLQILFIILTYIVCIYHKSTLAGIFTACAVLTKGPLGFLPLLVFRQKNFSYTRAWIVSLLLILPWYIWMYTAYGQAFVNEHIQYHIIGRALMTLEQHDGTPWFYFSLLSNPYVYPVFMFVVYSFYQYLKKYAQFPYIVHYTVTLSLMFILIPTMVQTKLSWYILPAYPFLALSTGMILSYQFHTNSDNKSSNEFFDKISFLTQKKRSK